MRSVLALALLSAFMALPSLATDNPGRVVAQLPPATEPIGNLVLYGVMRDGRPIRDENSVIFPSRGIVAWWGIGPKAEIGGLVVCNEHRAGSGREPVCTERYVADEWRTLPEPGVEAFALLALLLMAASRRRG